MTRKTPSKRRPAAEHDALIAGALRSAAGPVSAYDIIDILRPKATLAPQTVYRALDRLIEGGRVHRLESLNAFVACAHDCHAGAAVFAICDVCGMVREFDEPQAVARLQAWADDANFALSRMTLELRGRCAACAAASAPGA
ncbi:MAG: transcriptional repressor [Hyphomicrobiaceae bacterium]|nr:transcriptional repressor [Hyphomicrobiaceae bacterium]